MEDVVSYAVEILRSRRGSGATVDDALKLGLVHPVSAPSVERAVITLLFQSKDWSPLERVYHRNNEIFEWRIKLPSGRVAPVFFDITEVNNSAPLSPQLREKFYAASDSMAVPDTTLLSRFPLIKVGAQSAAEAADFIESHLRKALRDGWQLGNKWALVDGWRNEYDLSRAGEKTKMSFDMRPCLILDRMELTTLTMLVGRPRGEPFVKQYARVLVEAGLPPKAPPSSSLAGAVKAEKKQRLSANLTAALILLSMPAAAWVVGWLTNSVVLALLAGFSPILLYKLYFAWLIASTERMIRDSKREFPD